MNKVEEQQHRGGDINARIGYLQAELEYVMKMLKGGKHSGRHKEEEEQEQCPRYTYEKHEAGRWCPAEAHLQVLGEGPSLTPQSPLWPVSATS